MNTDGLKDKIKKLLALSESPNENEAAKAIQMAMKLCASGGLNMDDLKKEKIMDEIGRTPVGEPLVKIELWVKSLCNSLSELFACVAVISVKEAYDYKRCHKTATEQLTVFGYPKDVALFEYLYIYIQSQINAILDREVPRREYIDASRYRLHRESFALGTVARVIERAKELFKRDASAASGYALVLSRRDKVMHYLKQNVELDKTRDRRPKLSDDLIHDGYKAGDAIALNHAMSASERNNRILV